MSKPYTYEEAYDELQSIVSAIESGQINVDDLTEKIKRASELIAICKAKLVSSEAEVDRLLTKLHQEQSKSEEE
ncbi:exodeoxyribonuclease VII small subunit [Sphingobacterium sp. LRF_L2]|uniref:exodeoxyribonuclease VII small subunit n=1 Tax=Sphingobacterium sp. LRF_L2 TaxID=3369421 RepID=UPI003F62C8B4